MPRFGGSPSCARCSRAVYAAEQVVGPLGRPYHRACLACVVCARRLDSTLLVEHEGEAYCRNCHRAHLGQGKGGFGLSVPLKPELPVRNERGTPTRNGERSSLERSSLERSSLERSSFDAPPRRPQEQPASASYTRDAPSTSSSSAASRSAARAPPAFDADEDATLDLSAQVAQINISARPREASVTPASPPPAAPAQRSAVRSIDDAISSGAAVPTPVSRLAAARARGAGPGHPASPPKPSVATMASDAAPASPSKPSSATLSRARTPSPEPPPARPRSPIASPTAPPSSTRTIGSVAVPSSPASSSMRSPPTSTDTSSPTPTMRITRVPATLSNVPALNSAALPAPSRVTPRGAGGAGAKTAPSWTPPTTPSTPREFEPPGRGVRAVGLGSAVRGGSGTPLCARCGKAVYFAEQLQAAGRAWHRFCLRCDGCNTTLEPGKLEEGPLDQAHKGGCNVWCRTCYAKRFGPKGIGVGGISLPEHQ